MSSPLLSVRGVTAYYGRVKALKGVDIDVNDGETFTVDSQIDGSGALTKKGKGTLVLTASNSYSGGTILNDGVLSISSDSGLCRDRDLMSYTRSTARKLNGSAARP